MLRPVFDCGRVHIQLLQRERDKIKAYMDGSVQQKPRNCRLDREVSLYCRLESVDEMGDVTICAETSVHNSGGNGLFSLRSLEVGTLLPHLYPGVLLTTDKHDALATFLVKLTNTMACDIDTARVCKTLKEDWNLSFFQGNRPKGTINWDAVYDSFCAYSFDTGNGHVIFWNQFEKDGSAHTLDSSPRHAGLFINEPPPYKYFVNRLTWRRQLSQENVAPESTPDGSGIQFRVTRDISKGDEILFHYGDIYDRKGYDVAYSEDLLNRYPSSEKIRKRVREYTPVGITFRKDDLYVSERLTLIRQKII